MFETVYQGDASKLRGSSVGINPIEGMIPANKIEDSVLQEQAAFSTRPITKGHFYDFCEIVPGWIPDLFPVVGDRRFRFVHIDVDLYEPTMASIDFFFPRLTEGGVMLLDDHGITICPGARTRRAADRQTP